MSNDYTCPCGISAKEFKPVLTTITTPTKKVFMNWLKCPHCKREYLAKKEVIYKLHIIYKEGDDYELVEKKL